MYEVFEHTADLGLRVTAATAEQLFAEAGRALFSVIIANPDTVEPRESVTFHIDGECEAYLLFDWLNELLYTFDCTRLVLTQFEITMREDGLDAVAHGEPLDADRHGLEHEVKAITYHNLEMRQVDSGWEAQVILDI